MIPPDHPQRESAYDFFKKWPTENLYFEIHRYEKAQDEGPSIQMAEKLRARCVATQPVYYLNPEDHLAHEVMLSIGAGTTLLDEKRPQLGSHDFYLKSKEEMERAFSDHPEWLQASDDLLQRTQFEFETGTYHIPQFGGEVAEKNIDRVLVEECQKGLKKRLELIRTFTPAEKYPETEKIYRERLEEECRIISKMNFAGYFLIVADFIRWSKEQRIPVGPGRGSGAGSIAAYCLQITDIDPVRYNLLFERFLNPERISMPDFDIDFCIKGRDRVIQYVRDRYNIRDNALQDVDRLRVAQIATFGKMKSKAVIRDVGRALGIPYGDVDAIAKLVPNVLNITLADAFQMEPEFARLRERDPKADELLRIAERLEGLNRHSSVHAAGVVIADDLLTKYLPLSKGADEEIISEFEMKGVEKLGLLKFDFLGLRNLTVIDECIRLTGQAIDLLKIDYNDPKVMAEISSGDTVGVFQLESSGMRDVIRRLRPTCLEDLIAIVALYRPGPLEGGMVDDFILRKAGQRQVVYDSPVLEPILKETYGVFVYQEQVMKTANVMAGFSLGEADLLRRAMGKKIAAEMAKQREKFVKGAEKLGHPTNLAQKIFDLMAEFAKYGFNKSHAAAYAMVTFQTAYLKTYYPEAFYAALLSSEAEDLDKIGLIIRAASSRGVEVLSPHVNRSQKVFSLEDSDSGLKVRFGLSAIKNFGENVAEAVVAEREANGSYKNFEDFFSRAPIDLLNKRQGECLIRSGALDGLGATRSSLFASLDSLMSTAVAEGRDRRGGQVALFAAKPKIKVVEEWPDRIRLNDEKHLLGTYMTGHPLKIYEPLLQTFKTKSILSLREGAIPPRDQEVSVAGLVVSVKEIFTKKGTKMAFLSVEDREAVMEVVVFSDLYNKSSSLLAADRLLLIRGQVTRENDLTKMLAREISDLSHVSFSELHIRLKSTTDMERLSNLSERVQKFPGAIKVKVHIPVEKEVNGSALRQSFVTMDTAFTVNTNVELMSWLEREFGEGSISLR